MLNFAQKRSFEILCQYGRRSVAMTEMMILSVSGLAFYAKAFCAKNLL